MLMAEISQHVPCCPDLTQNNHTIPVVSVADQAYEALGPTTDVPGSTYYDEPRGCLRKTELLALLQVLHTPLGGHMGRPLRDSELTRRLAFTSATRSFGMNPTS